MPFTDNFIETTNTNLEDHTPSGGTAWTLGSGTAGSAIVLASNNTVRAANSSDSYYICDDQGTANHYTECDKTATGNNLWGNSFICVRLVDASNFIGYRETGFANSALTKCVSGTYTDLVSISANTTGTYRIEANGTTIKLFKDSIQQGTDQTVTDHQTETSQGFRISDSRTVGVFDNFEAGSLSTGISITGIADSLTITEGTSTIQSNIDINISGTGDVITLTEGTSTITSYQDINITGIGDVVSITEGTASIQSDIDILISANADTLNITEGSSTIFLGEVVENSLTFTMFIAKQNNINKYINNQKQISSNITQQRVIPKNITQQNQKTQFINKEKNINTKI